MSGRVAGKRVCITSAGGALGATLAAAFLAEGASVWLTDPDFDRARQAATSTSGTVEATCLDMLSAESRQRFAAQLEHRGIDVLVNHASVIDVRPFLELTDRDLDEAFGVNVKAMTLTLVEVAKHMVKHGIRGSVINRLGQLGSTTRRGASLTAAFNATNAAMTSITNSAALALALHGIRVNGIAPGPLRISMWTNLDAAFASAEGTAGGDKVANVTAAIPQGRFGEAADLVGTMLFLASDESAYVIGQTIDVDGGHHLVA